MSMRGYAVDDYGLLLEEETIETICKNLFKEDQKDKDGHDLFEWGLCEYIGGFTGETQKINKDGYFNGESNSYRGETIFFISLNKYPTLFEKPYENMGEIVKELRDKVREYLPQDFDYKNKIYHIIGTYYG